MAAPRAVDAAFTGWWLICSGSAIALILNWADQPAYRNELTMTVIGVGGLILLVKTIARWRDRAYGGADVPPPNA